MFFRKKAKQLSENEMTLRKLHGKAVKYVTMRSSVDYSETIIGRDGIINVLDDELVIICNNDIVFRHVLTGLQPGELMSLDGVTFKYREEDTDLNNTVVAYYKYYRK